MTRTIAVCQTCRVPPPTNTQFAVAVHVLTYLAGVADGAPVPSPELAGSVDASPEYIRRVMIPLRASGIVRSSPGKGGGWSLDRDPSSITLAEVWQLVQGDAPAVAVHTPNPTCLVGRRVAQALESVERDVVDAVAERLSGRSIADLLGFDGSGG